MKSFVITIKSLEESVKIAQRCIDSMPEWDVQMFDAITPADNPLEILEQKDIPIEGFGEEYSYKDKCVSAFLSHHTLWEKCIEDDEEYQIFEHDAVAISPIPKFMAYKHCVSFGAPSYGKYNLPEFLGTNTLFSKPYLPGAHAYRIRPSAAKAFVERAKIDAGPTDVFLNSQRFPWLQEYYPWPVEARDTFSTIQKTKGCLAKHSYNENYKLL